MQFFRTQYPWAAVLENKANLGFTGGNNRGIQEALRRNPDYVLLLNNDTTVDAAFLSELVKAGESEQTIGVLCPKIYYYDRPNVLWYAGGRLSLSRGVSVHYGFREPDKGQYDIAREVNFVTGCAFFIKREVIEKIGLLDETFFCYSEDADWSLRAVKAGYKGLYVPSSRIWHKIGMATKMRGDEFSMQMGTRNALYLVSKHAPKHTFLTFHRTCSRQLDTPECRKRLLFRNYDMLRGSTGVAAIFSHEECSGGDSAFKKNT